MVFSSLVFMFVFLPAVLAIYYLIPKKCRNAFLLIADLFFYGWGEPVLVLLMVFSIVINYIAGLFIGKSGSDSRKKKTILIISVIIDLGFLGWFKYAGFIADSLNILIPVLNIPVISVPLPVGISFYTFQIMSYTVDVYRGDCEAQKSLVSFGTYVSLFPQLIAGPIVRYKDIDRQLSERRESVEMFADGIRIFAAGLAKKVLIANYMGGIWDSARGMSDGGRLTAFAGVIAYSFQIYFDFSGYSDMARGLGNMFGFEFVRNFDYPYISKSITEFWRRWHISLGTWFKEYVYIPLGGNRKGKARQILNIFIVWFLTGFWHGAGKNFMLWGLYFGVVLVLEKLFMLKVLEKLPAFASRLYALALIGFGWIIFYFSEDVGGFKAMSEFIPLLFTGGFYSSDGLNLVLRSLPGFAAAAVASTPFIHNICMRIKAKERKCYEIAEIAGVAAALIFCTASLVSDSYNPFLYFKF